MSRVNIYSMFSWRAIKLTLTEWECQISPSADTKCVYKKKNVPIQFLFASGSGSLGVGNNIDRSSEYFSYIHFEP